MADLVVSAEKKKITQIMEMIRSEYNPKPSNEGYPCQYDDWDDGAETIALKIAALFAPAENAADDVDHMKGASK